LARFKVGFDAQGCAGDKAQLYSNGGWSLDLSQAVTDRALFHLDNCYYIPQVNFKVRWRSSMFRRTRHFADLADHKGCW